MKHHVTLFDIIPGLNQLPSHIAGALLVCVLLCILSVIFYLRIRKQEDAEVPPDKFCLRNVFELIVEYVLDLVENMTGPKGRRFFPIIGATFLFILVSNIMGLIPGLVPPTDNVNTNAACAIFIFLSTYYFGIKEHGLAYFKKLAGPVWWLAFLFLPIEIISHCIRPVSLTLRLYGNIFGDHAVLAIFSDLIPLIVPIPFLALGTLVSVIQALVFTLLSIVYISEAISHEH
ncbi:MAG: F0F1 ATP synthase subunit A [Pseudomonadota bacterium]